MMTKAFQEQGIRRQYPRRKMHRKVGVLCGGVYFVCESDEIGEGGMSILTDYILTEGHEIVVSVQIPGAGFVFLRGAILSTQKRPGDARVLHGIKFKDIEFSTKRQIRSFVSARADAPPSTI